MSKWWQILDQKRIERGWKVAEYYRRVNADGGPEISLASIRKYLKGKADKPRGNIVDRLGAPFGMTEAQLRYGIDNTTRAVDIPLLNANEIGTVDPALHNAREDSSVRFLSNDVGEDWFGVVVPDNACAPKILKIQ